MKKLIIHTRLNRNREFKGEINTGKQMTIPGQAITPQEIIRSLTTGVQPKQIYHDHNITSFQKLDICDKMDYLNQLKENNKAMADTIQYQINTLKQKQALQERIKQTPVIPEQTNPTTT